MPTRADAERGERLQKVLARAGVAARRACEELIVAGRVTVNDKVVTKLGTRVDPLADKLAVDGRVVDPNIVYRYYALYKPRGYVTTMDDPEGRRQASDLVPGDMRLYSVGRLDLDSEGLLLFTNDGTLALRLTHPRYRHEKEYHVITDGPVTPEEIKLMGAGIVLAGETSPCYAQVELLTPQECRPDFRPTPGEVGIRMVLHQGRKRQIRRMLEHLGHHVFRLVRVRIGSLRLGRLRPGEGRWLDEGEVRRLRQEVGLEPKSRAKGTHVEPHNDRYRRPGRVGQEHRRRSTGG